MAARRVHNWVQSFARAWRPLGGPDFGISIRAALRALRAETSVTGLKSSAGERLLLRPLRPDPFTCPAGALAAPSFACMCATHRPTEPAFASFASPS